MLKITPVSFHNIHPKSTTTKKNKEMEASQQLSRELQVFLQGIRKSKKKTLRFSDHCKMCIYEDHLHANIKSYSELEMIAFRRESIRDAVLIMRLLKHTPTEDSGLLLSAQLKQCGISEQEIIGVEHLVLEDPRSRSNRRKTHTQLVLMEYADQLREGRNNIHALAQLSTMLTNRPAAQARERAARVAHISDFITAKPEEFQARKRAARAA